MLRSQADTMHVKGGPISVLDAEQLLVVKSGIGL